MDLQTVFFEATDHVTLNGLLYKSDNSTKKITICVHGMATNCISKRADAIGNTLTSQSIDYLIFNNRGHDLSNYSFRMINGKKESFISGTSYENFSDCYYDIKGAIEYVLSLGYTEIYLQGHSNGSTKIVYTYQQFLKNEETRILSKIKAILLLSLVDTPNIQKYYLKNRYEDLLAFAEKKEKEDNLQELMPENSFLYPISVSTYLTYTKYSKQLDFANYSNSQNSFTALNEIACPLFMRWGNENELILQKAEDIVTLLKQKLTNSNLNISYIDGANHNYLSKEKILASQIVSFLTDL